MKTAKKVLSVFLAMILAFSITTVAFAEEEVVEPEITDETTDEETLNPFTLFGGFFVKIGELMRIVFEFLENMFSGNGNNALEELK